MKPPVILVVDDDEAVLFGCTRYLSKEGYQVVTAASLEEAKEKTQTSAPHAVLLDLKLPDGNALGWLPELKKAWPDLPVIVVTGSGDVPTAVAAMKNGAENFLLKPLDPENLIAILERSLEIGDLRKQNRILKRLGKKDVPFFGSSPAISTLMNNVHLALDADTVLLLQGETGTGKGVLARWIHENSPRKKEAFVELNCSCLKGDLLRSELFGHTRGAFTSAVSDREGLVEIADRGTLFLDEIGDMDTEVQSQILKTIEEHTYRRVGDHRLRKSDFRLVCATNKNLAKETEKGTFRKDLYYRICVFPLALPALRAYADDIPAMAMHLLDTMGQGKVALSPDIVAILKNYSWPGNVRELRNVMERAMLLARGDALSTSCFPGLEPTVPTAAPLLTDGLRGLENDYVKKVIHTCSGDKKKASEMLGISLATLYRKLGRNGTAES